MKEPIRSPTAVGQKVIYHSVNPKVIYHSDLGTGKEEPLNLNDADEVYPSDLDMSYESCEQKDAHFVYVPSDQPVLSASEIEPMFNCQDVRTKVSLN